MAEQDLHEGEQEDRPSWEERIRELFQRSWEMELLLFGFLIVFIWSLPEYVLRWIQIHRLTMEAGYLKGVLVGNGLTFLLVIIYITIFSMIVHLILRAFWIAIVGLSSVYPKGGSPDHFKLASPFRSFFKRRSVSLYTYEEKLENIRSTTFSLNFFLILAWVGIFLWLIIGIGTAELINRITDFSSTGASIVRYILIFGVWTPLFLVGGLLYLIDFFELQPPKGDQEKGVRRSLLLHLSLLQHDHFGLSLQAALFHPCGKVLHEGRPPHHPPFYPGGVRARGYRL